MNRVVLSGHLAGPPRLATAPCGVPLAHFRLHVPRWLPGERAAVVASAAAGYPLHPDEPSVAGSAAGKTVPVDEIPCVAWGPAAEPLAAFGRKGLRVAVEGRLHSATDTSALLPDVEPSSGPAVWTDRAYFLDPEELPLAGSVSLPRRFPPSSVNARDLSRAPTRCGVPLGAVLLITLAASAPSSSLPGSPAGKADEAEASGGEATSPPSATFGDTPNGASSVDRLAA